MTVKNNDTIVITDDQGHEFAFKYTHNVTEYGFFFDPEQSSYPGATSGPEASFYLNNLIIQNADEIRADLSVILADRLQKADGDANDAVSYDNLREIRKGLIGTQTQNYPGREEASLLNSMAVGVLYNEINKLETNFTEKKHGRSTIKTVDDHNISSDARARFLEKHADKDLAAADVKLAAYNIDPVPRTTPAQFAKGNATAEDAAALEKAAEEEAFREEVDEAIDHAVKLQTATAEEDTPPPTPAAPSAPTRLSYDAKIAELQQAFVDADPKYTNILRYSGSNGVDGLRGRRTNEAIDLYARENDLDASDLDAMIEHAKAHPYKAPEPEPAPEEKADAAPEEENVHTTEVSAPEAADEDQAQPEAPADTKPEKVPAIRAHWIAASGKPVMFDVEAENSHYQANGQILENNKGAMLAGFNVSAGVEDTHVRPEDNRWAKALDGYDPKTKLMSPDATAEQRSAAATGVIDIGRHGEIYVTRVDAHFGLDRYQVNDLIAAEGVDQLNVNTVPLMPGSEMGARFNNIMNDLGRFGQFDKAAGFVVTLESGLQARVFDGGQGMQLEIFKDGQRSPEIDRAQEQTPPFDRFGKYWYNDMNKAGETFDKIGRVGWSMPAATVAPAIDTTVAKAETPKEQVQTAQPTGETPAAAAGTGEKDREPDVDFNELRAIDNSMNKI